MPPYHGGLFTLLAGARGAQLEGRRLHEADERERAAQEAEANRAALALALRQRAEARAAQQAEAAQGLARERFEFEKSRPTPARNIDPLSPEGIQATVAREQRLAPIRERVERARRTATAEAAPRPESLLEERAKFAERYIQAAGGDPVRAMDLANQQPTDLALAKRLGMTRADYYAAAQRRKDAQARRSQGDALDRFMAGQGGAAQPAPPAPATPATPATPGSTGNIDLRAAPTAPAAAAPQALKPIPAADLEHARRDPSFAAWLRARGYDVPEAP